VTIPLDNRLCWAVLAPLSTDELRRIVDADWKRVMPYAVDGAPWEVIEGNGEYAAIVSDTPGSEGADRPLAERAAGVAKKAVYALWLDPEREQIFVWERGRAAAMRPGAPLELARDLGFDTERPGPAALPPFDVAVVEGASVEEVRQALGDVASEPWLRIEPCAGGVLLSSQDGTLGTQGWDAAEALPLTTTYLVQRWPGTGDFSVVVLQGGKDVGHFGVPQIEDDALPHVRGARTPEAISGALGIPPQLLGLDGPES
jgi:hypothetical protein